MDLKTFFGTWAVEETREDLFALVCLCLYLVLEIHDRSTHPCILDRPKLRYQTFRRNDVRSH